MRGSILVTGAGSGIGRAAALDLARASDGVDIILVGRRAETLEETKKLLPRSHAHTVVAVSQADAAATRAAMKKLELKARNLIGVVANAGVGGENRYGDGDRFDEIIATNLTGTYTVVSECLPALAAGKGARNVVIIASILARLGVPGYTGYCASKAGLLGLMRSWAAEYAKKGVMVNAILPGWVDTEMSREGIQQFASHTGKSFDTARADQMSMVPTGKMSTPEEIAGLCTYLMNGKQTSFTGQCFDMNNGALMP